MSAVDDFLHAKTDEERRRAGAEIDRRLGPMTKTIKTIEVWADTHGTARCRGCDALIEWATVVKSGAKMCFDGEIVALRTRQDPATWRVIEEVDLATNHWATCPKAAEFKRR